MSSGAFGEVTDPKPQVVCDAGPLIHLDEVGCLDLLLDFSSIVVPEAVREEVELHRPEVLQHSQVNFRYEAAGGTSTAPLEVLVRSFALDRGEQAAIGLALARQDSIFLTDDSAARLAARTLGIRVHGTIGILVRAIRRKQRLRSEILEVLKSLPRTSTLHIRKSLLDEVIHEVERAPLAPSRPGGLAE